MFHLNRKTEYALQALTYLAALEADQLASVSELAERYQIPPLLLSKVMQGLKRGGYVHAVKGCAGGYRLAVAPADVRLLDLLRDLEEPMYLVACLDPDAEQCAQYACCDIRNPMRALEQAIAHALNDVTLADTLGDTAISAVAARQALNG